ncbi:MAG: triphosphoribosyl-dephospho-CoA synthase, partial [Candidatus Phytoplasma australasiaticum]|nr:triphosphoribosyl-dephospho-CoA synthase [Candidatus Phytoplasma australasiaticum]
IKLALIAIETELLCYPSLGLVSINSCGSHQDMNFKSQINRIMRVVGFTHGHLPMIIYIQNI